MDPYPVDVQIVQPERSRRFWAIPLLGFCAKVLLLLPHLVILYALYLVVIVLQLVLWAPVLFGGRYARWGYELVGGLICWNARFSAYYFGLTDRYPPFSLGGAQFTDPSEDRAIQQTGQAPAVGVAAPGPPPGGARFACSTCGKPNTVPSPCCPHCGSSMRSGTSAAEAHQGSPPIQEPAGPGINPLVPLSATVSNVCAICQVPVPEYTRAYCAAHPERFHGQVYCARHQPAGIGASPPTG